GRSLQAQRRAAPAHDEHRVRRDERSARGPLRRHGRRALAQAFVRVRAPRVHHAARAPPGRSRRQAWQHPSAQAHRLRRALPLHRSARRSPRGHVLLGSRDPAPQLLERGSRHGRILRAAGTGMESPGLHGLGQYYEAGDRLWVNLFAPSTAEWSAAGVRLTMDTDFPEGERAKLTLTLRSPKAFTLAMRRPYWVTDGYQVTVNGTVVAQPAPAAIDSGQPRRGSYDWPFPVGSYVEIARTWKSGDVVEVTL